MFSTFTQPRRTSPVFRYWLALLLLTVGVFGSTSLYAYDVTVAKDGSGTYTTVQAAIDAAPAGRTSVYTIFIKNGKYKEKITVPSTKPFLQFVGESVANTILTFNSGASDALPGGGTVGTQNSASVSINATDFSALNITFENSYGDGTQAVAVLLNADRCAFYNCRFLGNQDTLYTKGSGTPHHYFKGCYIDGNIDFIFGSSAAVFDNCVVYAKTRTTSGVSYITAANTPPGQAYGYVFRNATLPANTGGTQYYLGRPWQNSTGNSPLANNKVVFHKARLGAGLIRPEGWVTWDAGTNTSLITDAEYNSRTFGGKAASVSQRVSWSQQLTPADTAFYATANVLAPWDPCTVAGICANVPREIAVSNFRAAKGATQTTLDWNLSWGMTQVKYELFRSADNVTFAKINEQTSVADSLVNFQTTDALPVAGTAYYYYLRASKAGLATHTTETIVVSSIPTLTATGTLGPFAQYATGASSPQTYTIAGANLTDNLTITPPANYEVSANGGANWYTAATPLVLAPTSNTLASTSISVRLNATAAGTYGGSITNASPGATPVTVAVTGTKTNTTAVVSNTLEYWPLRANAQDSTAIRSAAVVASVPTLRNLYVSNGTTVSSIPAYSTKFGQAFGVTANGDGSWGTGSGGPGANLNRRFSEQYTVTAAAGATVRVDSLILASAFYNTASGTKLAVVYSLSNFVSDSSDVTGGRGPSGTLNSTANGGFNTPILLANQTGGPTNVYRLALANATGLTLTGGQTLTIRLYFSCGSSSVGRYGLLKNVFVKGENVTPVACNAAFTYSAAAFCKSATTDPAPTVSGTAGGTFSSTTGLTINATTGVISLGSSTAGTYTVTYTAGASCTSTTTVTITAPAVANIGYAATSYCTSTTGAVSVILGTGSSAGTFTSSATGLTLNAATGAITPATSTPGTYFVTNTVAASGGCAAATGSTTVTITAPATAAFTYPAAAYCTSQSSTVAAVIGAGSTAGIFSSTTGLTLAANGTITPGSSTAGTYVVTNTVAASGGCAAVTSTFSVTINKAAVATFSYPTTGSYCAGTTGTQTPALATGSTAGTFSSTTGLTINATTGVINLATSTAGTYVVTNTVAAAGACAAVSATATVTINPTPVRPTVTAQYNGATTTLTSSAATGNQWLLNGNPITGATNQTYVVNTPAQYGVYTVVVTNTSGCASLPSATQTVTSSAQPLAGSSLSVYPNPTHDGQLSVELKGYAKAVELTLLNALGQPVLTTTVPAAASTTKALNLSQLPAGIYILRAKTEGGLDTRRIVKE